MADPDLDLDLDPAAEQAAELEVLDAVLGDDLVVLERPAEGGTGARLQVELVDDADPDVHVRLTFTHTPTYPAEPLVATVQAVSGVSAARRKQLQAVVDAFARDNLCAPVVYPACELARDWLAEHVVGKVDDGDDEKNDAGKFETLDATQRDQVEVISSKAVGTPVTVESFTEWQTAFLAELHAQKSRLQLDREANSKPTGRELFESKNMVVSAESESFWEAEADQLAALQ